jgi:hypothetical protein
MLNTIKRLFMALNEPENTQNMVTTIEVIEPVRSRLLTKRGSDPGKVTLYWCGPCRKHFPTERGWKIHTTKVHGKNQE